MRRAFLLLLSLLFASVAQAQEWPRQPIRFVVAGAPGSASDIIARTLGDSISKKLGVAVVIEANPAAGGNVAMERVAHASPDGYTWGLITQGTHALNAWLFSRLPYDPIRSFAPITLIAFAPNVMIVSVDSPAKSVGDLIANAKSKPAETFYGSAGVGTSAHLSGVLFNMSAGTNIVHVPYRGTPPALMAVRQSEVSTAFLNAPPAMGLIQSGQLRALAVTSSQRSALFPDLPTLQEAGLKDFDVNSWWGVAAPAGTPPALIGRIYEAIRTTMQEPDVRKRIGAVGFDIADQIPPDAFAKFVADDLAKWGPIIKASGAKAD